MSTTKFVVASIAIAFAATVGVAQEAPQRGTLPIVISGQFPTYPEGARKAHLEGTIRIKVWTTGSRVKAMVAQPPIYSIHKALAFAAERSLRTWEFRPHQPTTFDVVFNFRLDDEQTMNPENSTVTLQLPSSVEVRARVPRTTGPTE